MKKALDLCITGNQKLQRSLLSRGPTKTVGHNHPCPFSKLFCYESADAPVLQRTFLLASLRRSWHVMEDQDISGDGQEFPSPGAVKVGNEDKHTAWLIDRQRD